MSTTQTKVTIVYPQRMANIEITQAEFSLITNININAVPCIKFIKAQYDLDLYTAKAIVDAARSHPSNSYGQSVA